MKKNSGARIIEVGFRKYEGVNIGGYGENKWQNANSTRMYKKKSRLKRKWNLKKKNYQRYCDNLEKQKELFKNREEDGFFRTHYYGCYYIL
jgi:hypothetical protein